jgi:hypothetical protein
MNRLSMSLDQIIEQTETFKKVKHHEAKKGAVKSARHKENHSVGKFENKKPHFEKSHAQKDLPERPMKIITRERPKVITPDTVQQTIFSVSNPSSVAPAKSVVVNTAKANTASVFNRLGSSGTYVLFSNLKRSVEEGDIAELCRAIGEIKDVKLTMNFPGNNFARVLFSYDRDAVACVAKYHGE